MITTTDSRVRAAERGDDPERRLVERRRAGLVPEPIVIEPFGTHRLRRRRVDEIAMARSASDDAQRTGEWVLRVRHGGTVANGYGYRAETECVCVVSDPQGRVLVWCGRAPANKATRRGAALATLPAVADLFDGRVRDKGRVALSWDLVKQTHGEVFAAQEASR